ncbi:MAG TPA: hypothetical protein VGR22_01990 [Thermomicrobiales bacterium]|nr:hypothetical protein [Thermomicrobiales bacterium]
MLVIVVAVIGIAAVLLARTVQEAQSINAKAQNIATNGRGINEATDSVIQLNRTVDLAKSILESARPLDTQLGRIVATASGINSRAASINSKAGSINQTAGSINDTAGAINTSAGEINAAAESINSSAGSVNTTAGAINQSAGSINTSAGAINQSAGSINTSAGTINATARGIQDEASSILKTARLIDTDVELINENLDVSLNLVTAVKADTENILGQAAEANQTAACIDRKLNGQAGNDGDCQGQPQAQPEPAQPVSNQRMSRKAYEGLLKKTAPPAPKAEKPKETKTVKRRKVTIPLSERLPETPTTEQVNKIVEDLLGRTKLGRSTDGLLRSKDGLLRGTKDADKRRDALGRLLPELPLLGQR